MLEKLLINHNGGGGVKYSLYKVVTISNRKKGGLKC